MLRGPSDFPGLFGRSTRQYCGSTTSGTRLLAAIRPCAHHHLGSQSCFGSLKSTWPFSYVYSVNVCKTQGPWFGGLNPVALFLGSSWTPKQGRGPASGNKSRHAHEQKNGSLGCIYKNVLFLTTNTNIETKMNRLKARRARDNATVQPCSHGESTGYHLSSTQ